MALAPFSAEPPLIFNRSAERIESALRHVPVLQPTRRKEEVLRRCDIVLIAVADDAIAEVAAELAGRDGFTGSPFIFHLSGRCGAAVLEPLRAAGALTAAVHPVMTFTGEPAREVERMAGAPFGVTGSCPRATKQALDMVALLKGKGFAIAEEKRSLYHAALSHAANHLVTLLAGAAEALETAGVGDPHAVLGPLVRAAVENSLTNGFDALSGPLLRGDRGTVEDHLDAFAAFCPDVLPDYRAMALATLREMERHGMGRADAMPDLKRLLEG